MNTFSFSSFIHKHAKIWKTDWGLCFLQYWSWWNTNTEIHNKTITATKASGVQRYIDHFKLWVKNYGNFPLCTYELFKLWYKGYRQCVLVHCCKREIPICYGHKTLLFVIASALLVLTLAAFPKLHEDVSSWQSWWQYVNYSEWT